MFGLDTVGGIIGSTVAGTASSFLGIPTDLIGTVGQQVANASAYMVGNFMLWLSSWILWLAGVCLNFVSTQTIIHMRTLVKEITAIDSAWTVIRDTANIFFIFALLYVAIGTILQLNGANWKNTLKNLVIAALFINFSLFFTQVIIDASNIVTTRFYREIAPCTGITNITDCGVSNTFMDRLQIVTIYGTSGDKPTGAMRATAGDLGSPVAFLITGILGSVLMLVAAFVFASVAVMLVVRFIYFVFLMILSPLAFAGMVLPQIPTKKFWKSLVDQAVFAPVFFILAWVAIKILSSDSYKVALKLNGGAGFNQMLSGDAPSLAGLFFNYIIVIGFMIFALRAAKETGAQGSSLAANFAGKISFGVAGWAMRNSVGRAAHAAAESEFLKDKAASTVWGKFAMNRMKGVAGSSLDLRNTTVGKSVGKIPGGFGAAEGKGGFAKQLKDKTKAEVEFAKSLAPSGVAKFNAETELTAREEIKAAALRKIKSELEARAARMEQTLRDEPGMNAPERVYLQRELNKTADAIRNIDENQKPILEGSLKTQFDEVDKGVVVAREYVNKLKGVDEEGAKKWLNKDTKEGRAYLETEDGKKYRDNRQAREEALRRANKTQKEIDKDLALFDQVETKKITSRYPGQAKTRGEAYAQSLEQPSVFNRVGIVGPLFRKRKEQVSAIRAELKKGKKDKNREKIEKLLEDSTTKITEALEDIEEDIDDDPNNKLG